MKTHILIFAVLFITASINAQTNVSGSITTSTTWTLSNSPYTLTGDVTVSNGATLTIESGVKVNCKYSYVSLNVGSGSNAGLLQAAEVTFSGGDLRFYGTSSGTVSNCNFVNATLRFYDQSAPTVTNNSLDINSTLWLSSQEVIPKMSGNILNNPTTYISLSITKNITLKKYPSSDYMLNGSVTVTNGATLTIESGVRVNFQYNYYYFSIGSGANAGILLADGATFSGGDLRFYGSSGGSVANCNFINATLRFYDQSAPTVTNNTLDLNSTLWLSSQDVIPKMSGNTLNNPTTYISLSVTKNITLKKYPSSDYTLNGDLNVTNGATLTIESGAKVTYQYNYYYFNIGSGVNAGILQADGATFSSGSLRFYGASGGSVTNCNFINASLRFYDQSAPTVTNNTLDINSTVWLSSQEVIPKMSGNTLNNPTTYISLSVTKNITLKKYPLSEYWLNGDVNVTNGATLTIESGVKINFQYNYYYFNVGSGGNAGILQVDGATFSSGSLRFYGSSGGSVANCNFINANLRFYDQSAPTVANNTLDMNSALWLSSQEVIPKMSGNTLNNPITYISLSVTKNLTLKKYPLSDYMLSGDVTVTNGATLTVEHGVKINYQYTYCYLNVGSGSSAGSLQAVGSAFGKGAIYFYGASTGSFIKCDFGNTTIVANNQSGLSIEFSNFDMFCQLTNQSSKAINAPRNYWGHVSGPYHATLNPTGQGSKLSGDITFIPFYPEYFVTHSFVISTIALNGTVSKNPDLVQYDSNTTVKLTAIPAENYRFLNWSGDASGSVNPLTVRVNSDKNITANFGRLSTVVVTYPNGGETWYKGTACTIQWNSSNYSENVQVLLQKGSATPQNISGSISNTGSYRYTPPCNLENGSDYRVVIAGVPSGNPHDQSDANFTISNSQSGDQCAATFSLKFPLRTKSDDGPYTHPVISIFDHERDDNFIVYNNVIIDFVGDTATSPMGVCDNDAYRGRHDLDFKKKMPNYVGIKKCESNKFLSYDGHNGYDYRANVGTYLYITAPGKAKVTHDQYNTLEIDHGNGYKSRYLHNSKILVNDGDYITDYNTVIALSGQTGSPGNPHLHFTLRYGDFVVDPYGWTPKGSVTDPWPHPNTATGSKGLWEECTTSTSLSTTLVNGNNPLVPTGVGKVSSNYAILVNWIYNACDNSVDHFELTRLKSDGTSIVFTVPSVGCPYFEYVDHQVEPNESYAYYVKAVYANSASSGSSSISEIYSSPTPQRTQTLYSQSIVTIPFVIPSGGLYRISLTQPSSQSLWLRNKNRLVSANDSMGNVLTWELRDSVGNRIDRMSPNIGNVFSTDSSQTFTVALDATQTGIWNLSLNGTGNLAIGDSIVTTTQIDTTTEAVCKVDRDILSFYGAAIDAMSQDSVVISNQGNLPLSIRWTYVGASEFSVVDDSVYILPQQYRVLPITFHPTDSGAVSGNIIFKHNGPTSPDTILLVGQGGPALKRIYNVSRQWNMVSVPLTVDDSRKSILFPSSTSNAFYFDQGYIAAESLSCEHSYWLKYPAIDSFVLVGVPIASETVLVHAGWNMIGSLYKPIATASLTSIPDSLITSQFFSFASGYISADSIIPGKGYWVKVNQGGRLILSLNDSTGNVVGSRIIIIPTDELPPPPPAGEFMVATGLPDQYALDQNYPNPFNPATTFKYQLPRESRVRFTIYNVLGQVVAEFIDDVQSSGYKSKTWYATTVASGVYFYQLEATSLDDPSKHFIQTRKMLLVK